MSSPRLIIGSIIIVKDRDLGAALEAEHGDVNRVDNVDDA